MTLMTAASCQKDCVQNILIWLSGRAVKPQLQIVLIRLFAATDGYPISVKNEFKKKIFLKKIIINKIIFLYWTPYREVLFPIPSLKKS